MVQHADESDVPIHHIILVGHNSRVFDVPFLAQHLINYEIDEEFFGDNRFRYLHCCPVENQDPRAEGYDPAYKVAELRDALERRYTALFEPGQQLSLDETLIRAFGRIKFKVRIITKLARYGIKLYVITDAETAYVLCVIVSQQTMALQKVTRPRKLCRLYVV